MMKHAFCRTLAGLLAVAGSGLAYGQIYKCTSPTGSVEYTDVNRGKQCKAMDLPGVVVAAPPKHSVPAAPAGRLGAPAALVPGEFPRVDAAQQRARDNDRRGILEEELRAEQQKLAEQRKAYNNGEPERQGDERNYAKYLERVAGMRDSISRTEKNIDALKREIANIR
ncbi:DUF4124 domain-containing protein [Duganella qianjiadongensis]|uniref:DUF4124 domain-containing protein n=1 Tax=Duganella qianjiadongensis TaxID=2692176 RepID=A0ABW9VJB0_9BURK|nr:DUF4124 domain-containing protein [Duganella qianjiadongensis]MYM39121.1 DUF4124 domain-containing protein [Duganella qianjiadongensis]